MTDKLNDVNYKKRKAANQRAYYNRNKESERARALASAQSMTSAPSIAEARKKKHREAQARYRARRALESCAARTMAPDTVELQKQKHREAQARYQETNKDHIRLMRWVKTKEGSAFRLSMLEPVNDGDAGREDGSLGVELGQGE